MNLQQFKKNNKQRREVIAKGAGFKDAKAYIAFLGNGGIILNTKSKPTIHIVDILDASTSMFGDKISGANEAINDGIRELKKAKGINYTYTLIDFSSDIKTVYFMSTIDSVGKIAIDVRGMTALYQAVGETLERISNSRKTGDKVLVKIYTDGAENASNGFYRDSRNLNTLIKDVESKDFTVTFIGTDFDVQNMVRNLGVTASNTLSYDGTARGLKMSMDFANISTTIYASKVSKGEDVSKDFFKQTGKL